jgi:hypothetical protein
MVENAVHENFCKACCPKSKTPFAIHHLGSRSERLLWGCTFEAALGTQSEIRNSKSEIY